MLRGESAFAAFHLRLFFILPRSAWEWGNLCKCTNFIWMTCLFLSFTTRHSQKNLNKHYVRSLLQANLHRGYNKQRDGIKWTGNKRAGPSYPIDAKQAVLCLCCPAKAGQWQMCRYLAIYVYMLCCPAQAGQQSMSAELQRNQNRDKGRLLLFEQERRTIIQVRI